ncbi:hypothetical protein RIF29_19353 [Crotalaria pallida]|uniref:Uncharacterized protein n=1 Tax=Crotalaria pallida TaxID=3830 RepID=A0AAN9EZA9_CROPI
MTLFLGKVHVPSVRCTSKRHINSASISCPLARGFAANVRYTCLEEFNLHGFNLRVNFLLSNKFIEKFNKSKKDNFGLLRYQLLGEASILFLISHSLSHVLSLSFSLFLSLPLSLSLSLSLARSLTLPSLCRRDSRPIIGRSTQPYMS